MSNAEDALLTALPIGVFNPGPLTGAGNITWLLPGSIPTLIDAGTGALGQGLSISVGFSIANRIKKNNQKVFCMLGDGELQEGQIWEGLLYLESYFQKNLFIMIDYNKFQNEDSIKETLPLKNLKMKFKSFGFDVVEFNGHNYNQINKSFLKANKKNRNTIL